MNAHTTSETYSKRLVYVEITLCIHGSCIWNNYFFFRTRHAERIFSAAEINYSIFDTLGHKYHKEIIPIKNSKESIFLELKSNLII